MCVGCPDWVDYCDLGACYNPNAGRYGKYRQFYLGDKFCIHLIARYGHMVANEDDWLGDSPTFYTTKELTWE